MLLRSVRLDNFRAVKSAVISFEPTTVLIGENDCGRSSVLEAIAIALGWNASGCTFPFQSFHVHRSACQDGGANAPISVSLEFCESRPGEWDGPGFEILRRVLPEALRKHRSFCLTVAHDPARGTAWAFRALSGKPVVNDRILLQWLRRRMPVFRLTEGMVAGSPTRSSSGEAEGIVAEVSQEYRELLAGTATDIQGAIERGAAAAKRLLLERAKLRPAQNTPARDLLKNISKRTVRPPVRPDPGVLRSSGTAAHKIGLLLLVGALLRSGAGEMERGVDAVAILEDPEAHLHPMTLASIWSVIDRIGGQKIIATHSGTLLASASLSSVRRLTRHDGVVKEWRVPERALTADELRRYSYHVRSRRASASFARCWLFVEGETEYWLMNELGRICGYELGSEGVACVEFAQCGLEALIKVAQHFGIEWHLLADGDMAGQNYARTARECAGSSDTADRITLLRDKDIEHCFWTQGYQDVFMRAAFPEESAPPSPALKRMPPKAVIRRAIERHSKPYLATLLLDAAMDRGSAGVPALLRRAIETCVRLARTATA